MAKLVPGALGDPTATGKPAAFAGSMADAIETAMHDLLPPEQQFDPNDNSKESRDRRILFVAIAQGVVSYLNAHADAFIVTHTTGAAVTHSVDLDT
jgi:hypothetical protein